MLDQKFIEAIGGLGSLGALLLVVLMLAGLLYAVLRWMKEREQASAEHVKVMMTSYANLNAANEAMIARIERAAKFDQEYAEKLERNLRDERAERQSEIANLRALLADLEIKHQAALKEIAALRAELAEKQASLDELEGKLASIQKQRDNLKRELTAVQTQNAVMAIQISKLESGSDRPPEPPKAAPKPRLMPRANGKDDEEKDMVDLGLIDEVDDENVA